MITRRGLLLALAAPPPPDLLLYDIPNRNWLAQTWTEPLDEPQPAGSLLKPFLALAAPPPHPAFRCAGNCWLNRRHGRLALPEAIAQSCNRWFDQWSEQIGPATSNQTLARFALPELPEQGWRSWRCPPQRLLLAWAELVSRRSDAALEPILTGLRLAAAKGTAQALGPRYLAKTGTSESKRHAGDGWTLAAWPAELPTKAALYRQHGVPGAEAAARLARWLA
jgi:hypothetical protein